MACQLGVPDGGSKVMSKYCKTIAGNAPLNARAAK